YVLFIFYTNAFVSGLFSIATTSSSTPRLSPHVRQHIWPLHAPLLEVGNTAHQPRDPSHIPHMHIDLNRHWGCNPWTWGTWYIT
ncbi:uncharacterized protein EV420DRAFT_1545880, partial [Desarmillaria tabescens]